MKHTLIFFAFIVSFNASASLLDSIPVCVTWTGDLAQFDSLREDAGISKNFFRYDTIPYIFCRDSLCTVADTMDVYSLAIITSVNEEVVRLGECVTFRQGDVFVGPLIFFENVKGGGGGGGAQFSVTEYKTPGTYTYTVPEGAIALRVVCIGGGGGGGSGRLGAAGSNRCGGSGAWSGGVVDGYFLAYDLDSATYTVTVGAGGEGGAAQTTSNTNGNDGADGQPSSFSTFFQAPGGASGQGGINSLITNAGNLTFTNSLQDVINYATISIPNGGGLGRVSEASNAHGHPQIFSTSISATASSNFLAPGGGGGGAGVNTSNTAFNAATHRGGSIYSDTSSVVPGVTSLATYRTDSPDGGEVEENGGDGVDYVPKYWKFTTTFGLGTGGSGGGGSSTSTPAGNGGRGGHGGGGGGGGGGGTNGDGAASGKGGDGGDGGVLIIAFF